MPRAVMRVLPADIYDGVVPENAAMAVDEDVAFFAAAVVVAILSVLWDVLV